jgi:hypothetical protein
MVVARLVVMATIPLLAVMAVDVAVAMVPLMVASTTNPGNYPDLAVALCHTHSASCASKLGTLQKTCWYRYEDESSFEERNAALAASSSVDNNW